MTELILSLFLIFQGVPLLPDTTGTVTGIVRTADGKPAVGIRVVAVSPLDSPLSAGVSTLVSLTETDAQGRYRLENVPSGRHYIAAGRLDVMTYFPGVATIDDAAPVQISAGITLTGIDFISRDEFDTSRISEVTIPVRVIPERGGSIPINSYGKEVQIHVIQSSNGTRTVVPLGTASLKLPMESGDITRYRIHIENLPDGFTVKSMSYGSTDLQDGVLPIIRSDLFVVRTSISATVRALLGTTPVRASSGPLTINLTRVTPFPASSGVLVTGRAMFSGYRTVYLSGTPGIFFSDRTFEFRGVQPGRHSIVAVDNLGTSESLGASIVVGDSDVEGVALDVVSALPFDIGVPMPPDSSDGHSPGVPIPLAILEVGIVDAASKDWIPGGTLIIAGHTRTGYYLRGPEGRFVIPGLFPGKYDVEFQNYGYATVRQSLVVAGEDIHLEFALRPEPK